MYKLSRGVPLLFALIVVMIVTIILSACQSEASRTTDSHPKLKMSAATLVIVDVEFSDRFPPSCSSGPTCQKAKKGNKILIVWLEREDGGDINEISEKLFGEVIPFLTGSTDKAYVIDNDGIKTGLAVANVTGSRYALVFAPPDSAQGFKLIWPNNLEIDLRK